MNALKIILLQYRQYHKLDLIFYWQIFSLHFLFFSFWFFHRWSSGAFSPSDPAPWKGKVPPSASSAPDFLVSPTSGGFRSGGPLALAQILPEENRHSPERVLETTQGSKQAVLCQDDRKHRQEFRSVLFPFSREDLHRFPLRVQAASPYRRKTPRPMGS